MTNLKESHVYCLFKNRYELPQNEGELFSDYDFKSFTGKKTEKYYEALKVLIMAGEIRLYVTGLTPALCEFLADAEECMRRSYTKHFEVGRLMLLHFNMEIKQFQEVEFIHSDVVDIVELDLKEEEDAI